MPENEQLDAGETPVILVNWPVAGEAFQVFMQKSTRQFVIVILFASVITAIGFVIVGRRLAASISNTHTVFLLWQLQDYYAGHLARNLPPAVSKVEFLNLVGQWNVDWNSCDFREGIMHDSWDTEIRVIVSPAEIEIRSAGPDRKFDSTDDIFRKFNSGPTTQPT